MRYRLATDTDIAVTLNESDRTKAILRNLSILLRTRQGSVPFYREFGLPMNFLDRPVTLALPVLIMEVREAILKFEPRAEFVTARFTHDITGAVHVEVEVNIRDEQASGF